MKPTDNGRRQHEELERAAVELEAHAAQHDVDTALLRRQLARFGGKLLVHATMEEQGLYPRLLASEQQELHTLARKLLDEVQHVYVDVGAFVSRFTEAGAIEADVGVFRAELTRILTLLRARLVVENEQLYPAADALL